MSALQFCLERLMSKDTFKIESVNGMLTVSCNGITYALYDCRNLDEQLFKALIFIEKLEEKHNECWAV